MNVTLSTVFKVSTLNIMDDCIKKSLSAYADYSIQGERFVDVVKDIIAERGKPDFIRVDNDPGLLVNQFTNWCQKAEIEMRYLQPGSPMQNGNIERLNRTFIEDVLDAYQFDILER